LERLFELIARHVDGALPGGEAGHRDLLQQMAQDMAGVRPAVHSQDSALALDEFQWFRHLVRNVYTIFAGSCLRDHESGGNQDTTYLGRADHGMPAVVLGYGVGNLVPSPIGMGLASLFDLLHDGRWHLLAVGMTGMAKSLLQGRIAALVKAGLPETLNVQRYTLEYHGCNYSL
jgi:hypothetical protein